MGFNNRVVKGKHYDCDKIKFTGSNTQGNIVWRCSGNTYKEIYNWLVEHDVITRYDYDPVDEYLLGKLGKSYDDYTDEETEEMDFDRLYRDGEAFLTDEAYKEIISNEDGNAFYQDWE